MAKILCIIDSFKGSLTSNELGSIAVDVLTQKGHDVSFIPISDGGDGFLDCIEYLGHFKKQALEVLNPNREKITAHYLIDDYMKEAYIELAQSSGIHLIDIQETSIFSRTTFGLGQLINHAINQGMKKIYIGLGGSATNDGGAGMLEAMGVRFLNAQNREIKNIQPKDFISINQIDLSNFIYKYKDIEFIILADVENPLLGNNGASYIFGPQKGLLKHDIELADAYMKHYAYKLEETFQTSTTTRLGSGAAGGTGFALMTACHAIYHSGIEEILNKIDISNKYDYIITGEGKVDSQSLNGKVIYGVIKKFKDNKIIIVCGKNELDKHEIDRLGIHGVYDIIGDLNVTLNQSLGDPKKYFRMLMQRLDIKA